MSGVELGFAIGPIVDLCVKWGNQLIKLHHDFRNAEREIIERLVQLQSIWVRTKSQLDFLTQVWNSLGEELQEIQSQSLHALRNKLSDAVIKVTSVVKKCTSNPSGSEIEGQDVTSVRRFKYALVKESISKTIRELQEWQQVFDPSWFIIMRIADPKIDIRLPELEETRNRSLSALHVASGLRDGLRSIPRNKVRIFHSADGLDLAQAVEVPFSTVRLARRIGSGKWSVIESIICPSHADQNIFIKDVRRLALKLHYADPLTFGLLKCHAVIKYVSPGNNRLESTLFVFDIPTADFCEPESLRKCLLNINKGRRKHSLSERFRLAQELAKAVTYIHTFGFVHKNIRPEAILLFQRTDSSLGSLFLLGLEDFRAADGRTIRMNHASWERDLYRHPSRQGERPQEDYIMQHDIYSLGVCLLEIGLCKSFVEYEDERRIIEANPSQMLVRTMPGYPTSIDPQAIKSCLLSLARTELLESMGTRYADVVETCLTCLDPGNTGFGDEADFFDEDGILVSVRYIEKILSRLSEIHT